jgi:hypothetical protein
MRPFLVAVLAIFPRMLFKFVGSKRPNLRIHLIKKALLLFMLLLTYTRFAWGQSQNLPITGTVTVNFGLPSRAIGDPSTTDTVLSTDEAAVIVHVHVATLSVNETLPTAVSLGNTSAFVYAYCNNSPQTDTITPSGSWTIQAGNAASGASLSIVPGVCYRIHPDPSSSTNWLAELQGSTDVSGSSIKFDQTSLSGNVAATTMVTPSANGRYRFNCYEVLTTAASTSSSLPSCQVSWTDADTGTVETKTVTNGPSTNTVGLVPAYSASNAPTYSFYAKSGAAITYATTGYASSPASAMQYAIHVWLEGPF